MRRFEIMPSVFLTGLAERPKLGYDCHEARRLQTAPARGRYAAHGASSMVKGTITTLYHLKMVTLAQDTVRNSSPLTTTLLTGT